MKKRYMLALSGLLVAGGWQAARAQVADTLRLEEVVVTGTREPVSTRELPITVTVVERGQLEERHEPSVLTAVMQQVPGLLVTGRQVMGYGVSTGAAGGISLRGLAGGSGQLLVLIDGHPQYSGIYGHPIADSYQSLMTERVEVLRGPASVLYGSNAMGGVVNIITRSAQEDGVKTVLQLGSGSYGTVQTEVVSQVRSGRLSGTVGAQYNRTDNHRPRMGFGQEGGYMRLGYDMSEHWKLSLDGDLMHFEASYPGSTQKPIYGAEQWITRGVAMASVENRYGRTSGAVSVYSNFGRHKIDDGSTVETQPTKRLFRSQDALTGVSWHQVARLFRGNRLTVGMDYQHIYGHAWYTDKATDTVMDTPNKQSGESRRNEVAGYADLSQDVASWLTVDAGVRVDHHSVAGTEWVPQAGVVVRPMASGEVKAVAGKGFRNPTMREMYLYPPSNEDLQPERLWNYELSWRHRVGNVAYGLNLYHIKGDNMIQTAMVDGKPRNVNTGAIENTGGEAEATWNICSNWSLNTNHALLHMKHKVLAAPTYKGFLGVAWRSGGWHANVGVQYVNGLYTAVGDDEQTENFCLVDASLSYRFSEGVTLWARADNLLNQQYEFILGYPMPGTTLMAGVSWEL